MIFYNKKDFIMEKYVFAFDLAMGSTGITIFRDDASVVLVTSIDTKKEEGHPKKLKKIADFVLDLKNKYPPNKIIIERGFYRFNTSTQAIYRVHGVIQYLFSEFPQIFYPPIKVKKVVGGKGNMKKDELRKIIEKKYDMVFSNNDESDSFAVGICHFIKEGII